MDKFETRRLALQRLVDQMGYGGIAKVAQAIGKEPNYVSRMLYPAGKAGRKRIGEASVDILDEKFPGWLSSIVGAAPSSSRRQEPSKVAHGVTIEQYDAAGSMGYGLDLPDQPGVIQHLRVSKEWLAKNVRTYSTAKNLCVVTGFGDSMQPMFNPGDPLLVDLGVTTVEFDAVYFFRVDSLGYVKRLQRIPTENGLVIRAISENKAAYGPFDITEKMDFQVLGRVLKVWRSQEF